MGFVESKEAHPHPSPLLEGDGVWPDSSPFPHLFPDFSLFQASGKTRLKLRDSPIDDFFHFSILSFISTISHYHPGTKIKYISRYSLCLVWNTSVKKGGTRW